MAIAITRTELSADGLRAAARGTKDSDQARRLLALALVLDGASRTAAARAAGMDRQTLRDWVHRYNAEGIEGLCDRPRSGRPAQLCEAELAELADLVETARHLAAASPGARLDPPLLMALDEIGNLSPLPSMPVLMAEGGGTGITTMPVLQSLSQARDKWGDHAAGAIWDASIVKVVLGGTSAARDLQDLSALIGERDERTDTISVGDYGSRSLQRSMRRVAVMPPEAIRTLPFGTALVLLRSAPPVVTDLRPWTVRRDAKELGIDRTAIEATLRRR